jgi:hypothetical protein
VAGSCENKANLAQLRLELGLSLAIENKYIFSPVISFPKDSQGSLIIQPVYRTPKFAVEITKPRNNNKDHTETPQNK